MLFCPWFLSSLFIIRVPFFLLFGFGFNKGALNKKGKRVPLGDLVSEARFGSVCDWGFRKAFGLEFLGFWGLGFLGFGFRALRILGFGA